MQNSTACRALAFLVALTSVLCLPSCGSAQTPQLPPVHLASGETVGPVATADPLHQSVAVAYLEPQTELGVDVISGVLYVAAESFFHGEGGPGRHEGLIGLEDPQSGHRMFAYTSGGIPGQPGWNAQWGVAPAPAPGISRYPGVAVLSRVWELRENLSAYNATYVALAEGLGCALLTADRRLGRAPGLRCPVTTVPR